MIKGKSLSDSSTSESEDDGNKIPASSSFLANSVIKYNIHSVGKFNCSQRVVEDHNNAVLPIDVIRKQQNKPFKRKNAEETAVITSHNKFKVPTSHFEMDSSTSESEDDYGKRMLMQSTNSTISNVLRYKELQSSTDEEMGKTSFSNFKIPMDMREVDSSTSESEEDYNKKLSLRANNLMSAHLSSEEEAFDSQSALKLLNGKSNDSVVSSVSMGLAGKMMAKMGWSAGEGLGKYNQGRTEIVEASKQRGRRGLGLEIKGFEPSSDINWNSEKEKETIQEEVVWIPECHEPPLPISLLRDWKQIGKKKEKIEDETDFCDSIILKGILEYKSVFDSLEPEEMRKARTRSNPFETIRGGIFLNRAAMKMANIDSCFDYMFTDPKDNQGKPLVGHNELLYFADICAGPGGFSEYVLWRKRWGSKGFGFTLKGQNDFKLDEFFSGPPETFEPHYGVNDDGNIYTPQNLREFRRFVLENTGNKGVHFVMADGGFSVEGQENIQEILSKRLYLCQFLCALMILRPGGHFVCKVFDLFTPFSVGLVYLLYHAFERVCIFKPNTSRPANSERYVVCKWRKNDTKDICDYLYEVNDCFDGFSVTSEEDVAEVVPLSILKEDENFFDYMLQSNNKIGERQITHLDKIRAFAKNADLHETLQSDFRKQCLAAWKIPDKARQAPTRPDPNVKIKELMKNESLDFQCEPKPVGMPTLNDLSNVFHFKCVVCGEISNISYRGFFLGLGRSNIYRLDFKTSKWVKLEVHLELPVDTLFYGELIPELKGEGRAQKKIMCLQIIDALVLGGRDVRNLPFDERLRLSRKLAKAVSKPSRSEYTPLKVKKAWRLTKVNEILKSLVIKNVKGHGGSRLCFDSEDDRHFIPSGVMIFETVTHPWVMSYSKTQKLIYYFNTSNGKSKFEQCEESAAKFKQCFTSRFFWNWDKQVMLLNAPSHEADSKSPVVHGHWLKAFVCNKLLSIMGFVPPDCL